MFFTIQLHDHQTCSRFLELQLVVIRENSMLFHDSSSRSPKICEFSLVLIGCNSRQLDAFPRFNFTVARNCLMFSNCNLLQFEKTRCFFMIQFHDHHKSSSCLELQAVASPENSLFFHDSTSRSPHMFDVTSCNSRKRDAFSRFNFTSAKNLRVLFKVATGCNSRKRDAFSRFNFTITKNLRVVSGCNRLQFEKTRCFLAF